MADEKPPHSLQKQTADQIRNEQRGGAGRVPDAGEQPDTEGSATMRRVWSEPGGEAQSLRSAMIGAGGKSDDHGELTAEETPETTRHLSDASLSPKDKDATAEAIERATAVNGKDEA